MKLCRDQEIIHMVDVPLEDVRDVLAALMATLKMKIIRAQGHDYTDYDVVHELDIYT